VHRARTIAVEDRRSVWALRAGWKARLRLETRFAEGIELDIALKTLKEIRQADKVIPHSHPSFMIHDTRFMIRKLHGVFRVHRYASLVFGDETGFVTVFLGETGIPSSLSVFGTLNSDAKWDIPLSQELGHSNLRPNSNLGRFGVGRIRAGEPGPRRISGVKRIRS
jgi:hypothetical protein